MSQKKSRPTAGPPRVDSMMLEHLPIPVFSFDGRGNITSWSRDLEALTGTPASKTLGLAVSAVVPSGDRIIEVPADGAVPALSTEDLPGFLLDSCCSHKVIVKPVTGPRGKPTGGWVVLEPQATPEAQLVLSEIRRIGEAVDAGDLDVRGGTLDLTGVWAEAVQAVNRTVDALVAPLRLAAGVIQKISVGEIPEFVIEEYQGEFHQIKRNVNTFLATMYGMHHETRNLVTAIQAGKLHTRGNHWDYEGNWSELVQGVNRILDAVIEPVQEAGGVLARLAAFDLRNRVEGKYKGDHAQIKKALNSTISALNSAMGEVAGMAAEVASTGEQIAAESANVTAGAEEQAGSISEASSELDRVEGSTRQNAQNTDEAQSLSVVARTAVSKAKEATDHMVEAMEQIRESAEDTIKIIEEINGITEQTNELATKAADQATKVGESARGFNVVAKEVRTLSQGTRDATTQLEEMTRSLARIAARDDSSDASELSEMAARILATIHSFNRISLQTNMLAVNASVEAAHVGEAGLGFEKVAATVRDLASVSIRSSERSNALIKRSVDLSREGEGLSKNIGQQLMEAVDAVGAVAQLIGEVAESSREQTVSIEALNKNMSEVRGVTQRNASNAKESTRAATSLLDHANRLNLMVGRFQLTNTGSSNGNGARPQV